MTNHPTYRPAAPAGRVLVALVMLGAAVLIGYFVVPDIGPSVRAARGDGRPGRFVAVRLDCAKRCLWHGEFRPDSGGAARRNVWIEGAGRRDLRAGEAVRAMDTGARSNVYTPEGRVNWLGLVGGSVLMVAFAVAAGRLLWRVRA